MGKIKYRGFSKQKKNEQHSQSHFQQNHPAIRSGFWTCQSVGREKAISADSMDIVSVLQNFAEKRPLVDCLPSTSGQILAKSCRFPFKTTTVSRREYHTTNAVASYASVKTLAGVFAGGEGYDVNVRKHTELTAGLVTSTDKAEAEGKNRFSTGTLSAKDIKNHSSHSASGISLAGGVTVSGSESAKEIGGMKLKEIGQNHQDGSSKTEFSGIAGIGNQGNWGIAKGVSTALLGQVSDKSSEGGITTSAINTRNIIIRDQEAQKLTGSSAEEVIQKVSRGNTHQTVNKANIEQIKSDLDKDLVISKEFVNNVNNTGDEIYYKMEKNEDSVFSIQKGTPDCNHIDCLSFDSKGNNKADNSQEIKGIIYGDKLLTEEQAKLLSKTATAGMLNFTPQDKVESAILYDNDLASIDETGVIINRGSAGYVNEFIYTGFERFRAWANMPSVFGASNATRDTTQIWKKLDEYNAYAKANNKPVYDSYNLAHSLGVSGNKNALNWSEYVGQKYSNTNVEFQHLGGSYPSKEIHEQAKEQFGNVSTRYLGIKGDFVYSGIKGQFIGNNPNATQAEKIGFGLAHSDANQNINNLKYIYNSEGGSKEKDWNLKDKFIQEIYPPIGVRKFNTIDSKE